MKRLHIHLAVENLEKSIQFYSALFGQAPSKEKSDYAKWMLDDPRVNFAISTRGAKVGLDHLGFQVDSEEELTELREQMKTKNLSLLSEGETTCCYAASDKSWVQDPSGTPWEVYHTMSDVELFSSQEETSGSACCAPSLTQVGKGGKCCS